ncbi:ComEA family DNA-binding protein [Lysobacter sp. MMG2]|uniref:ComEA family DNA-binding protein n=1 Tax=Lysobacter sp. MMG2 TaxID=2801338 RepID=UPI001C21FC15|nr:ComEA family DNA-binding protein [Lysobacter sp. MMG2]MBU8976546.1 ComEA family DNA-binding protein [Lysobacter sp. MMG2]
MKSIAVPSLANFARALLLSLLLAAPAVAAETVNVNTADAATLDRVLVNIGPSKAEAIVAYRKTNGPFRSADQLAQVPGIGLKTVEKNKDRIVFAGGAAASAAAKPAPTANAAAAKQPAAPVRR